MTAFLTEIFKLLKAGLRETSDGGLKPTLQQSRKDHLGTCRKGIGAPA